MSRRERGRELAVTLLYVPADRVHRVRKALSLDADVVIVDLEDAVASSVKADARAMVPRLLAERGSQRVQVRVNALDTQWGRDDLAMVSELDADVELRLPKVCSPHDIDAVERRPGSRRAVHCLIETAVGVERAFEIASHSSMVASISLGEHDLRSELGVTDDRAIDWARGRAIIAASAAGLPPPAQSVYTRVRDHDGLAASCRAGRAMGFVGRCAIHPAQLPVIRAAYQPDQDEIRRARELVDRLDGAEAASRGVAVLADGSFVDAAMVAGAYRVLELAELTRAG